MSSFPRVGVTPKSHSVFERFILNGSETTSNAAISNHPHISACLVLSIDMKVNLPGFRVIIDYVISCLHLVSCLRRQSSVFYQISSGKHLYFCSNVGEIHDYVDAFVCREPFRRELQKHSFKVKTVAPMELIFVPCNDRESPSVCRISFGLEWYNRITRAIRIVIRAGIWVRLIPFISIYLEDFQRHQFKNRGRVLLEDYSSYLNIRIAQYTIICSHVDNSFGLMIVQEVGCGPGLRPKTSQRAIQIVKNVAERVLVTDFYGDSSGIKLDS